MNDLKIDIVHIYSKYGVETLGVYLNDSVTILNTSNLSTVGQTDISYHYISIVWKID